MPDALRRDSWLPTEQVLRGEKLLLRYCRLAKLAELIPLTVPELARIVPVVGRRPNARNSAS
jgi:hypothetical protein